MHPHMYTSCVRACSCTEHSRRSKRGSTKKGQGSKRSRQELLITLLVPVLEIVETASCLFLGAIQNTLHWNTYPDVICPTHMWFHACRASELWHEPSFSDHFVEGIFQPAEELDASIEWSALLERSRANAMQSGERAQTVRTSKLLLVCHAISANYMLLCLISRPL
jgi:hypothetical protein